MLKLECEDGKVKVGVKTKYGLGGIAADLIYCVKGLINAIDDPEKETLKTFIERCLGKIVVSDDDLGKVLDILAADLLEELIHEYKHKQD